MFTKEDLSLMKYKELVVIAKQYGVYKPRSKKVNLLNKLLSIPFDQMVEDQHISVNATSASPALRRNTYEIVPCVESTDDKHAENDFSNLNGELSDTSIPSIRRETFCVEKDKVESSTADAAKIVDSFENTISESPALRRETYEIAPSMTASPALRRDTYEIVPCIGSTDEKAPENDLNNLNGELSDTSVPSIRRETFNVDKEENLYSTKSEISVIRQNTFSIDKPKEKLSDKIATPTVSRQGTFSLDTPSRNNIFEEMPGIICKEFKNTPVKPYIVKAAATCSPVRTRSSIQRSVGPARSIGQRIESQRSAQTERRPSSRGSKTQKNLSVSMVSVTPIRVHKPSVKGGRIEKKITPSKLPNFKAIHLREFSKMESIVEHTQRKAERTKALLTPLKLNPILGNKSNGMTSLVTSRIPVKFDLSTAVVEPKKAVLPSSTGKQIMATTNTQKNENLRKSCVPSIKDKLKFIDSPMTKVKRKSAVNDITNKIASNPKKRVQNVKEIVTTKMHPYSVERNRAKGRDFLQSVRMNRRFQLQMEVMRKAKV